MRKVSLGLAALVALSFAAPAFADDAAPAPAGGGEAAAQPAKKGGFWKWLGKKFRKVAHRIKKKVGDENWQKLRAFYKENIKPKVEAGEGRLRKAFIRFAKNFRKAFKKEELDKFLEKAKGWWAKKPAAPAPSK